MLAPCLGDEMEQEARGLPIPRDMMVMDGLAAKGMSGWGRLLKDSN